MWNNESTGFEPVLISEINHCNFSIPAYQRGYRWQRQQVYQLLNDIVDSDEGAPYYLQPVVVARTAENSYDLIDGQQRLTTIYLIIQAIKKIKNSSDSEGKLSLLRLAFDDFNCDSHYNIEYKTRISSKAFLQNISSLEENDPLITETPDHLYMWHAFSAITHWLTSGDSKVNFKNAGHLTLALQKRIRIIWYELPDTITDWKKFTDLNIGKIPLTNSELIKALFLRSDKFSDDKGSEEYDKQTLVAQWDQIERELSDTDFWGFLTTDSPDKYPTKIDLIFDLISQKCKAGTRDKLFTFNYFVKVFKDNKETTGKQKWEEIYIMYQRLLDWYHDRSMYHLIGYLVAVDYPNYALSTIFKLAHPDSPSSRPKENTYNSTARLKKVLTYLVKRSLRIPFSDVKSFEDLKYNAADITSDTIDTRHHPMIKRYLTLYSIMVTESASPSIRYPFAYHNSINGGWSLEHIHAQKSESLHKSSQWIQWTKDHMESLKEFQKSHHSLSEDLKTDISKLLSRMDKFTDKDDRLTFNSIASDYSLIMDQVSDSGLYQDEFANMALLGKVDNSTLNNSTFDVKRRKIIDMLGTNFVPIATERVFLKAIKGCETEKLFYWGDSDRKAYIEDVSSKLKNYL